MRLWVRGGVGVVLTSCWSSKGQGGKTGLEKEKREEELEHREAVRRLPDIRSGLAHWNANLDDLGF